MFTSKQLIQGAKECIASAKNTDGQQTFRLIDILDDSFVHLVITDRLRKDDASDDIYMAVLSCCKEEFERVLGTNNFPRFEGLLFWFNVKTGNLSVLTKCKNPEICYDKINPPHNRTGYCQLYFMLSNPAKLEKYPRLYIFEIKEGVML